MEWILVACAVPFGVMLLYALIAVSFLKKIVDNLLELIKLQNDRLDLLEGYGPRSRTIKTDEYGDQ